MKKYTLFLILLALFCGSHLVLGQDPGTRYLYVSPVGNDKHPGTKNQPFKTLNRAKEEVAALNKGEKKDIVIYLRAGSYTLSGPLTFNPEDGGSDQHTISYKNYEGEEVVLSGGKAITGWSRHEKGIWKAPTGGLDFRQIYVNGNQTTRARYPNTSADFLRLSYWDPGQKKVLMPYSNVRILEEQEKVNNIEVVVQMVWANQILRLKEVDLSSADTSFLEGAYSFAKLAFQEEGDIVFARDWPPKQPNQPFHFENAYNFLDEPGEWFLDTETDTLYYMPDANTDMASAEVIVPVAEQLLVAKGTLARKLKNLTFEGLTFQYTNWTVPHQKGFTPTQAGQNNLPTTKGNEQYVERPESGIYVEYADQILFTGCAFTKMGNPFVLDFNVGVTNSAITGNVFYDLSGSSMQIAKFSDGETHQPYNTDDIREITQGITISNNYVTRVGLHFHGSNAITVGYGKNIVIEYNEVSHAPYTGISLGWGWVHHDNVMADNLIQYNNVHHVVEKLGDAGGIYTLSKQPGTRIYRNYVHHIRPSRWAVWGAQGIYLDEGSGGSKESPMIVEENLITSVSKQIKLNRAGYVMCNHNFVNPNESTNEPQDRVKTRALVMKTAGLQPEYQHLKNLTNN